jgi:hypothetical protein
MPRDEYGCRIYQQRRSASVLRLGARYAPYNAETTGLKSHATCPEFNCPPPTIPTLPEASIDQASDISSAATLVNPSFDQDKGDSPSEAVFDKPNKSSEKKAKSVPRTGIQSRKLDHFLLLIDMSCKIMNDVWPQNTIPTIYRYQSGATYGYNPNTRGLSVKDFPDTQPGSDLVSLKKFVTELLKRSRSTAATFQTALCYLEAVRPRIPELQQAEIEGRGTRGEPVGNAQNRVVIDPQYLDVAEEENRKMARGDGKCKLRKPPLDPGFPLPDLPSPLLCPRRTLMGALVLSAKFVQDKCYSNRAWAKLCGLPPREVSRCERALGDVLGWRLWVGREMLTSFGGLDTKLERTSTAILTSQFNDEPKVALSEDARVSHVPMYHVPLLRESTVLPSALRPVETEFAISPVPSLASSSSSGSGSSNWPSGNLSPLAPSPLQMFGSNDPSTASLNKLRIASLIHSDTFICDTMGYEMRVEAAFDIRVSNEQEVY